MVRLFMVFFVFDMSTCVLKLLIAFYDTGRETDYGRVARDFEAMADEYIKLAVYNAMGTQPPMIQGQPQQPAEVLNVTASMAASLPPTSEPNAASAT